MNKEVDSKTKESAKIETEKDKIIIPVRTLLTGWIKLFMLELKLQIILLEKAVS